MRNGNVLLQDEKLNLLSNKSSVLNFITGQGTIKKSLNMWPPTGPSCTPVNLSLSNCIFYILLQILSSEFPWPFPFSFSQDTIPSLVLISSVFFFFCQVWTLLPTPKLTPRTLLETSLTHHPHVLSVTHSIFLSNGFTPTLQVWIEKYIQYIHQPVYKYT